MSRYQYLAYSEPLPIFSQMFKPILIPIYFLIQIPTYWYLVLVLVSVKYPVSVEPYMRHNHIIVIKNMMMIRHNLVNY